MDQCKRASFQFPAPQRAIADRNFRRARIQTEHPMTRRRSSEPHQKLARRASIKSGNAWRKAVFAGGARGSPERALSGPSLNGLGDGDLSWACRCLRELVGYRAAPAGKKLARDCFAVLIGHCALI